MPESLMSRIIWMSQRINELTAKVRELSKNTESKASNYTRTKKQLKLENLDIVFDGVAGIWKTYAIYKGNE